MRKVDCRGTEVEAREASWGGLTGWSGERDRVVRSDGLEVRCRESSGVVVALTQLWPQPNPEPVNGTFLGKRSLRIM